MRKASLWIAAVSIVYAVIPIVSMLIAATIANIYGCSINESGTSVCETPIGDLGELLSMMGIFGWFVFFTVPTGLIGLIIAIILFAASFISKRNKEMTAAPQDK